MDAKDVIQLLNLVKHPEGGWFKETYRCAEAISSSSLPDRYGGERAFSTSIFYLVTGEGFAAMHRVTSDEVFHFYMGDAAILSIINPAGELTEVCLGTGIQDGQIPQFMVPRDHWQGIYVKPGAAGLYWAQLSHPALITQTSICLVEEMLELYPQHERTILRLTR